MPCENVMIVFWSRLGTTERLALAAALGAVQGRAKIRLRWLREEVCDESIAGWRENRERMSEEYIAPRPIDVEWAQGIVLAAPADAPECRAFFSLGSFAGKKGALLVSGTSAEMRQALEQGMRKAGFDGVITAVGADQEAAVALGRQLAMQ